MSGHSKWSTIKRQKETTDKRKGQVFSKLARVIAIAAHGGTDPESNFKLRLAIEKARQANMPKENIDRALHKAQGEQGSGLQEVTYEGYGPGKIAIIIEAVTDNKNRTTAEIKNIFEKGGGSLTAPGAVSFQFKQAGLLTIEKDKNPDEQILKIIDLGVEDVEEASDAIEVYTKSGELDQVRKRLEEKSFRVVGAELVRQPTTMAAISDKKTAEKVLNFMEKIEEHDDVQRVFANFDIPDEILSRR